MQNINAKALLLKYKANKCTAEEKALLESWYIKWNEDQVPTLSELELKDVEMEMMENLELTDEPVITRKLWPRFAVAASIALVIGIGSYLFYSKTTPQEIAITKESNEIAPGGNKAVLILANGKRIDLEDAKSGALANEGNAMIKKAGNGQLIYDLSEVNISASKLNKVAYNVIETPRAGTYKIILPDGSAVWLNAASRLRFPSEFSGDERNVELSGEAYFEVAKNPLKPFKVITERQTVQVLGTHFNVNSYKDEPVLRTTLLEGSVRVSNGAYTRLLKPGQQTELTADNQINVSIVDTDQAVAWKNGVFSFKRSDLKTTMRQIARWYDVEVEYQGQVPNISFTGKIYRNVNLQEALKSIGYLDVNYNISGKKVIIKSE